jgi:hypothetical protein
MGRMSPLHNPAAGLEAGTSVVPASRNGGSSNADVNGAAIDLRGKRGAYFILNTGAMTGTAAVAARLQTGDNPDDSANANWTNVNYTVYSNAQITNKTNASSVFEMDYVGGAGKVNQIRAVLTPEANVSLASISHVVF